MYGQFEPSLEDKDLEDFGAWSNEVDAIADELYHDIKKNGVMVTIMREYTEYPRFSSAHATVLEEMTAWSIDYKDHQNDELLDAMFNESKREKLLAEFCYDYAVKSMGNS